VLRFGVAAMKVVQPYRGRLRRLRMRRHQRAAQGQPGKNRIKQNALIP
jgi:hypothetical protein